MAFDKTTRNRLQRFVNDARKVLEEEFTRQLQNDYGLDPTSGAVTPLENLRHINDTQRATARILRDTLAHYCASRDADEKMMLDRIVREQAFTVLNRLAALRMAEARGLLIESVDNGYQAKGFQLYARLAGTGLGETGDAYRIYLFSVFDELAQDLPGLFDRYLPQGRLFPRNTALLQVLALINDAEIESLWGEDETLGWIYQYFNSKEERKAMRDASQAPRNSRELAVRNQFFTPRYVVEFLVDNTLGRLWFNATGGQTVLRDRCQYLLVKPDERPATASRLRDPRTLKLLDPACGSMHFGLYAFDLFVEIYRESWDWEQQHGPGSLDISTHPDADLKPLNQTYADQDTFLRAVPRLIIEQNIYGVDIDPRAVQIASLALWLRAQRAWHDGGVKAKDRQLIGRGHVVAAIAPPAERELREQFAAELDHLDADLFEKTLQLLKGLPELGVLLQVERELPRLIRQVHGDHGPMFKEADLEQWQKAEARLRVALTEFVQATKATYQGQLFAQDALEGFKLIDLTREKFDVVLMNPPFGLATRETFEQLKKQFPSTYTELFASFVSRGLDLLRNGGLIGAITSRAFLTTKRLQQWRQQELLPSLELLLDLGGQVMDAALVESCAYVLKRGNCSASVYAIDARKTRTHANSEPVNLVTAPSSEHFSVDREDLKSLPGGKLLYSIPSEIHSLLRYGHPFEPDIGTVRQGMGTFDDFRFVRTKWEVPSKKIGRGLSWEPLAKGGAFAKYYSDIHLMLNWAHDGSELGEINIQHNGQVSQVRQASDYWRRAGCTFSKRSQKGFSVRALPSNCIITGKGPAIITLSEIPNSYLLGWFNSRLISFLVELQANYAEFNTGILKQLPWKPPEQEKIEEMAALATEASIKLKNLNIYSMETNSFFIGIPIESSVNRTATFLSVKHSDAVEYVRQVQKKWDQHVDDVYGVNTTKLDVELSDESDVGDDEADTCDDDCTYSIERTAFLLISYCFGVSIGRWNLEIYANGEKSPDSDDPFSPLPICPPGQLQNSQKLPLTCEQIGKSKKDGSWNYPIDIPAHGILVDDPVHRFDVGHCLDKVIHVLWKEHATTIESESTVAVGEDSLRDYFRKPHRFFADHLSQYSKSRRKAPIYWPLATSSGSYTLWLYYPSLTSQTLYTAINDFVDGPNGKLRQVGEDVAALRNKGASRSQDDEKQFEIIQTFELELIELRDILLKIAQNYHPNRDDGVQITAAPLWPLFRHKPWQKVLKDTWAKLEKGDYDWAHLAMNYWPERVREKCKTDKSLAIAHDLEELYVEPEVKLRKARGKNN